MIISTRCNAIAEHANEEPLASSSSFLRAKGSDSTAAIRHRILSRSVRAQRGRSCEGARGRFVVFSVDAARDPAPVGGGDESSAPSTVTTQDLQRWNDFLAAQIEHFDAAHIRTTGSPHEANPILVTFLKVNDEMSKERVERAIEEFATNREWPSSLTGDQLVNLTHRANNARDFLTAIHAGSLPKNSLQALRMPHASDRKKMIRWLFVLLWNLAGPAYLNGLPNSFLSTDRKTSD